MPGPDNDDPLGRHYLATLIPSSRRRPGPTHPLLVRRLLWIPAFAGMTILANPVGIENVRSASWADTPRAPPSAARRRAGRRGGCSASEGWRCLRASRPRRPASPGLGQLVLADIDMAGGAHAGAAAFGDNAVDAVIDRGLHDGGALRDVERRLLSVLGNVSHARHGGC